MIFSLFCSISVDVGLVAFVLLTFTIGNTTGLTFIFLFLYSFQLNYLFNQKKLNTNNVLIYNNNNNNNNHLFHVLTIHARIMQDALMVQITLVTHVCACLLGRVSIVINHNNNYNNNNSH